MKPYASAGRRRRADARAGFALIEMLAGLLIAVAILSVLAQFTSQMLRFWNRGETDIAVMEMLTSGLGRLKTDLALALPMRPPGSDSTNVMFVGEPAQLTFVAATGFGAGNRGLEMISVAVTRDGEEMALVRQRGPVTTGPVPLRDPVVLFRGRMQIRFTYRDDDGQTLPVWSNQTRLPKAVAVEIFNTAGASLFPVPLLMKLPVNMAAGCVSGSDDEDGGCPRPGARQPQQGAQDRDNAEGQ